jgi:hypothetical protein
LNFERGALASALHSPETEKSRDALKGWSSHSHILVKTKSARPSSLDIYVFYSASFCLSDSLP